MKRRGYLHMALNMSADFLFSHYLLGVLKLLVSSFIIARVTEPEVGQRDIPGKAILKAGPEWPQKSPRLPGVPLANTRTQQLSLWICLAFPRSWFLNKSVFTVSSPWNGMAHDLGLEPSQSFCTVNLTGARLRSLTGSYSTLDTPSTDGSDKWRGLSSRISCTGNLEFLESRLYCGPPTQAQHSRNSIKRNIGCPQIQVSPSHAERFIQGNHLP